MISVCTVLFGDMSDYVAVFADSISRHAKHVTEVVLVKVDVADEGEVDAWERSGIRFRVLGYPLTRELCVHSPAWTYAICGHALGMHYAIDHSRGDYVWLSDPDVFLLNSVDEFYLSLMQTYGLTIVGASHFNPADQSYATFPCMINCLVKRSALPGPQWLAGELYVQSGMRRRDNCQMLRPVDGKYLIPGPPAAWHASFPNPQGIFDAGCNLYLWTLQQRGRWIGFHLDGWKDSFKDNFGMAELVYPLNYNAGRYTSNFKLSADLGRQDLLYHRTRGARESSGSFRRLYESLIGHAV
jgi:hypothetical protein